MAPSTDPARAFATVWKALADAERCVALAPQFSKGFNRMATALYVLGRYKESEAAAKKGLEIDATSGPLQETLKLAQVRAV